MKRIIMGSILLCAIALGRGIVGNYFWSYLECDSSITMEVYRDSSGRLQTHRTGGYHAGDPGLTKIRFLPTITAKMQREPECESVLVYKALLWSPMREEWEAVIVVYKPPDGILVAYGAEGEGIGSIAQTWTRLPTVSKKKN